MKSSDTRSKPQAHKEKETTSLENQDDGVTVDRAAKPNRTFKNSLLGSMLSSTASKDSGGRNSRTLKTWRSQTDAKVVGLKNYGLTNSVYEKRLEMFHHSAHSRPPRSVSTGTTRAEKTVEAKEDEVRAKEERNPFVLLYLGNLAALKVLFYYLVTFETILSCGITVGLTMYWYYAYDEDSDWEGGGLDFVLLAFILIAPISAALSMAFARRERALISIADFRTWSHHLYLAHSLWDWTDDKGGRAGADVDWVEHCDAVLAQLIGIGDELARFLSLPTTSRSRHRLTKQGRREAARTIEVAYLLLESMTTQRMTRLVLYSERIKRIGLQSGEVSRMRQYERFLSNTIEQLRMVKMYRTPQAFRSFARIFTLVLPPFYAPTYAQVAHELNSLGMGVAFGIITALGLTALFESLQVLEDPFTAFLTLDGIDVREEFEVLHYAQLCNTRKLVFPEAPEYPAGRRAALTSRSNKPSKLRAIGLPPVQGHHRRVSSAGGVDSAATSFIGAEVDWKGAAEPDQTTAGLEAIASYDEEEADIELGTPIEERSLLSIRSTVFNELDESNQERVRLGTSSSRGTLRSRHKL